MRTIQRVPRRRTNWPLIGCGCAVSLAGTGLVALVALLLLLPALPGLALQFSGFSSRGSTSTVFSNVPPPVTVQVQNAVVPPDASINLGALGVQAVPPGNSAYQVAVGTSNTGAALATVAFTETGLMDLCFQRSEICASGNSQFHNARIDLRPGGGIIYADVYIAQFGLWQPVGVVLRLDGSRRQFELAGVDVNGVLFDLPPNELGQQVESIARAGNDLLNQISLDASGGRYILREVVIDESTLTLVMQ